MPEIGVTAIFFFAFYIARSLLDISVGILLGQDKSLLDLSQGALMLGMAPPRYRYHYHTKDLFVASVKNLLLDQRCKRRRILHQLCSDDEALRLRDAA